MNWRAFVEDTREVFITGTRQILIVGHTRQECENHPFGCVVHAASQHSMVAFPTHWRSDRGLMERLCPHWVGHPDPDHLAWVQLEHGDDAAQELAVHGCDGCCAS